MLLILFIGLFLGLSYICLGIKKHRLVIESTQIKNINATKAFAVGSSLLVICLVFIMYAVGVGIGLVYYLGLFTVAHVAVILLIHYFPKKLAYLTGFYFF